ncbi:MAG TPA: Fe-S protein assembly co-chaperone HscB [Acidisarcina sp.]|nr:Fe-S protein assembly co-chaperone HscB [Acidisarcina sp.]
MPTAEEKFVDAACWNCAAPLSHAQLFCTGCGKVQPAPDGADYFEVFQLPRKLTIDTAALERQFYHLSRKLHPDIYARASEREQEWSLRNASLLNDAYRTLKEPIARTEYLLRLEGVPIEEEGRQAGARQNTSRVPEDLLEEVFELNMQLEEMRMTRKSGDDDPALREELVRVKQQFEAQLGETDNSLQQLWQQWDEAAPASADSVKQRMVALLDRRRYIRNLVRDVNETLDA